MNDRPDQHGLDLFDRKASAVGGFPNAMLGYDKKAVDDYIRDLEQQVNVAKHQLEEVRRELIAANLRIDDTDFSKLGSHTASMLQVAEAQAGEILQKARTRAAAILTDAQAVADRTRSQASQMAEQARLDGIESIKTLRAEMEQQTAEELATAKTESEGIRSAADTHRELVLTDAKQQAEALVGQAQAEAERVRAEAQREAADVKAQVAADREQTLRELETKQTELQERISGMVESARSQSEEYQTKLTEGVEEIRQRLQRSYAEAEEVKAASIGEAQAIVSKARADADALLQEADTELIRRREKLRHDSHLLRQRKQALITQLQQLSNIANVGEDEYPDEVTGPIETSGVIPQILLDELVEESSDDTELVLEFAGDSDSEPESSDSSNAK